MKKMLLLIFCFAVLSSVSAQDLILTTEDVLLEVEIVSVDKLLTFYKQRGETEIKFIRNEDIKAIERNTTYSSRKDFFRSNAEKKKSSLNGILEPEEKSNALSHGFTIVSGACFIGSSFMLKEAFTQDDGNVDMGYLGVSYYFLGGAVVSLFLSAVTKVKSNDKSNEAQSLNRNDFNNQLLKQNQSVRKPYLSTASRGIGIQFNF